MEHRRGKEKQEKEIQNENKNIQTHKQTTT